MKKAIRILIVLIFIILIFAVIISFCDFSYVNTLKISALYGVSLIALITLALYIIEQYYVAIIDRYHKIVNSCKRCVLNILNRFKIELSEDNELDLLSPTENASLQYVTMLKRAIVNPNVNNIAISGSYGSGKSSIIKTFQKLYPKYKCLNLSLANFAEEHEVEGKRIVVEDQAGNKTITKEYTPDTIIDLNKLEYSLVQQFFYHVRNSDVPFSRYGRINRLTTCKRILYTVFSLLFILSAVLLWNPLCLTRNDIIENIQIPHSLRLASLIYVFCGIVILIYKLIAFIYNLNSAHIKAVDYEIELQKDMDVSILNRYLDELVYLFQVTDYSIVVLEDLDRFERTSIFTKLRELNQLLNQAKDINRRIVFVYALKDEVFKNYHERTKFFDLIISVLPVVNSSNSSAIFIQKFTSEIRNTKEEKGLDKEVVMDLAPYINDMRSIKSVVTDYYLYKQFLHDDLQMNNLLAMLVYKTKYPADFEDMHEGKSCIVKIIAKKSTMIMHQKQILIKELHCIDKQLVEIENEHLKNQEELKSVVVVAYLKCIPSNYYPGKSNSKIALSQLTSDDFIDTILSGESYALHPNYSYPNKNISKDDVYNNLEKNFDYEKRMKTLSQEYLTSINELKQKRHSINSQIERLNRMTIKEICNQNPLALDEFEECKNNQLLKFLLRKGYVNEEYAHYITIFVEGVLNQSDNDYLMKLKNQELIDDDIFSIKIEDPTSILHFITDNDFENDKILNMYLVHAIFSQLDDNGGLKYKHQQELLLAKLSSNSVSSLDFINRYAFTEFVSDNLLEQICKINNSLWCKIMNYKGFSNESRLNLFEQIMKYASEEDICLMNKDGVITDYLSKQYYWDIFHDVNIQKTIKIIKSTNPKFVNLSVDNKELLDIIYNDNLFELTLDNIIVILSTYDGNFVSDIVSKAIYTSIMKSNCTRLKEIVNSDIVLFVKNVICNTHSNTEESEEYLIQLLNNSEIPIELKYKLLENTHTLINDVTSITDFAILQKMFEISECVIINQTNLECYFDKIDNFEKDKVLINFLNHRIPEVCDMIKSMDASFTNDNFASCLFLSNDLDLEIYKSMLANPILKNAFPIMQISGIEINRLKMAISYGYIPLNTETFKILRTIDFDVTMDLLARNIDFIKENISKYDFWENEVWQIIRNKKLSIIHCDLIKKIRIEDVNTVKRAEDLLELFVEGDLIIDVNIFNTCILNATDIDLIKSSLTEAICREIITDSEIFMRDYIPLLDEKYQVLKQTRKDVEFKQNVYDQNLLYALKEKLRLISKITIEDGKIRCKTRHRK